MVKYKVGDVLIIVKPSQPVDQVLKGSMFKVLHINKNNTYDIEWIKCKSSSVNPGGYSYGIEMEEIDNCCEPVDNLAEALYK